MSSQHVNPSATVVILAWNAWDHTRACLESLHPTLRPGDQVVVLDNGSTDATGAELLKYPWVEVLTNDLNRGFASGCNQGAALARGEVVVFLNNDTVVHDGWLQELLAPFNDAEVGAVGPRSNSVSGVQLIADVSYERDDSGRHWCFRQPMAPGTRRPDLRSLSFGGLLPGRARRHFPCGRRIR